MISQILKWLKYSGATIALTLNPCHWGFYCKYRKSVDVWEQDAFVLQILPLSIRIWIDNGDW
jgi:EamA domain-containing membrane protein RarD